MKIEAVITCVNHADFLAHTLMMNKSHFDKIIVVTSPEDKDTPRICEYWRVPYHVTDAFQSRWGQFAKGKGINEGLARLDRDAWICHMDADIALPPNTREALEQADLDPTMIYGIDRVECKSYEDWARFIGNPEPNVACNGFMIHTTHSPFKLGTRVAFSHSGGYIPIGFFQLWHADSGVKQYLEGHSDAGREDSHFTIQWPRRKRGFIPEVTAYHLESESAEMAVNWKGRKTKPFSIDSMDRGRC
jgi:glycosyl transferase family 2